MRLEGRGVLFLAKIGNPKITVDDSYNANPINGCSP